MARVNLTEGAIAILSGGDADKTKLKPVLQVADIRLVNTQNNNNERYRVLLSDGVYTQQGMLAMQCNYLVHFEKLQKGSIVQLTQFVCNVIQNRMIVIIIDLYVIAQKRDPIGEPKPYPSGQSSTPDTSIRDRFFTMMNKQQPNPRNTPVTGPVQNTPPPVQGTRATAVRSDTMPELKINLLKEVEFLRNELHLAKARERKWRLANDTLTEEMQLDKATRLPLQNETRGLEEAIQRVEMALMAARCAEARAIGYDEGIARFPLTTQGQAFMKRFWEEEKVKFLKSGEFLYHLRERAFMYFNYGYDSAVMGLSKQDAVNDMPELPGFLGHTIGQPSRGQRRSRPRGT